MPGEKRGSDLLSRTTPAAGVFFVVFFAGYLVKLRQLRDPLGYLIGHDFVNTWMGARAAMDGTIVRLFDFDTYQQILAHTLGPLPQFNWSYPPHILLFIWPFAWLPYLAALAVWLVLGFGLYLLVASAGSRSRENLFFLAVSPAVAINLLIGQNGFFTAVFLIVAARCLDRRPLLAGLCLGLLTIKPQLAMLFPAALILSGRWRVIASAAATALVLAGLTTAIFGVQIWTEYLRLAVPFQTHVLNYVTGMPLAMMPSAFMNARLMGATPGIAWLAQAPFTLLAIAAVVWTFWKRRDPELSMAVLITAGFVATPYIFDYDMVAFGWLIARLRTRLTAERDTWLAFAVWTLPMSTILLGLCHVPLSAVILAVFLIRLVRLLRDEAAAQPQTDRPMEPKSFIVSSMRAMMDSSPARSHLRGS